MELLHLQAHGAEQRQVALPMAQVSVRESGSGDGTLHLAGHAAVFNRLSYDLGGFREKISPNAFHKVLDSNPDVHLVIGHDLTRVLARTRSKTLELREDPMGLRVWARLDPEDPDVKSLVPKMRRGDMDQMSFRFTVANDEWEVVRDGDTENVIRTITEIDELMEVSVVAQGAYPQTDANLRSLLDAAIESGRVPQLERTNPENVATEQLGGSTETDATFSGSVSDFERTRQIAIARNRVRMISLQQ